VSHSYQTYFGFPGSDLNLDCGLRDHVITRFASPTLFLCGGKTRGVKKVREGDENYVEKIRKQPNFYAREGEVKSAFFTNKPMILLVYKELKNARITLTC